MYFPIFSHIVSICDMLGDIYVGAPMFSENKKIFSENQCNSKDIIINFDCVKKLHKKNQFCKKLLAYKVNILVFVLKYPRYTSDVPPCKIT